MQACPEMHDFRYVLQAKLSASVVCSLPGHAEFAMFYKRIGGLGRGHFIPVRSETPPIRYVLQAELACVGFPQQSAEREFAMFYKRI